MNFKVAMGDDSYTSRIDFDNEKFYKMLDDFDGIPVTSQITAFEYQETFEKLYSEGYTDVINTTINSKGSATYNNAVMAAEEFYSVHPGSKGQVHYIQYRRRELLRSVWLCSSSGRNESHKGRSCG